MTAVILILSLFCQFWISQAALDTSICKPVSDADSKIGPKKPVLQETYTARVECNLLDQKRTTDVIEYFDKPHNRGTVFQTEGNETGQIVYSFDTNELFIVNLVDNTCTADTLTQDSNNFLFGFKSINSSMSMIFTANGALRFGGDIKEKYLGKSVVRGMVVDGWQSCTYWPNLQATSLVKWYFTDASAWQEAIGADQLPVRCEITGRGLDFNKKNMHNYHHIYEFSHYRPYIDTADKVFETPVGTLCPGSNITRKLPTPSNYFSYEAEIVIPEAKIMTHQQQWYDFTTKLFRYDWTPLGSFSGSQFGKDPLTTIMDFNTGVTYYVDRLLGNCSMVAIDPTSVAAVKVNDTVRMRTPAEFFDFNINGFQYEGVHQANGIDSHVWITYRDDWPADAKLPTSWEWYFATKDWVESSGNLYEAGEPKRLEIRIDNQPYAVYNIYNYNEAEPVIWSYDISDCYSSSQQRHFQFELPGSFKAIVLSDEEGFKYAVLLSIIGYTAISPIRVSNIQVDYDETSIRVTFTMLDVAPSGGNVQMGAQETPLDAAANVFLQSVQTGVFVVDMPVKSLTEPIHLTANPTLKELQVREYLNNPIPPVPFGYNAGSMAALGVIMAIVGFLLGGAIIYGVYRKNGGSFAPQNAPQSFENPVSTSKE